MSVLIDDKVQEIINTESEVKQTEKSLKQVKITSNEKVKRNKWTTESMKVFLSDFESMHTEDMCKKYGLTMKSLYLTKSRIIKLLSEVKNDG